MTKSRKFEEVEGNYNQHTPYNGASRDTLAELAMLQKHMPRDVLQVSRMGATITGDLSSADWIALIERVQTIKRAYLWILADILRYGIKRQYGTTAGEVQQVSDITGLSPSRLNNLASLAQTFEFSRRRENLSIRHHFQVQSLPEDEQDDWLDKAAKNGWSARELFRQMNPRQLPDTVALVASKDNRNRMNRLWRIAQSGNWKKLKREDIEAMEAWLKAMRDKL